MDDSKLPKFMGLLLNMMLHFPSLNRDLFLKIPLLPGKGILHIIKYFSMTEYFPTCSKEQNFMKL